MAGLLVLSEFDNIMGYIFEFKVNDTFPKLQMVDDILKDEFKVSSQKIAKKFTDLFLISNAAFVLSILVYYKSMCPYFDQYWIDTLKGNPIRYYSTILIVTNALSGIFGSIGAALFMWFPFLTVRILKKIYSKKESQPETKSDAQTGVPNILIKSNVDIRK